MIQAKIRLFDFEKEIELPGPVHFYDMLVPGSCGEVSIRFVHSGFEGLCHIYKPDLSNGDPFKSLYLVNGVRKVARNCRLFKCVMKGETFADAAEKEGLTPQAAARIIRNELKYHGMKHCERWQLKAIRQEYKQLKETRHGGGSL
jgi:hypothetical protein